MDKKYRFLHFLEIGYESFYLMGDEDILDELNEIAEERRAAQTDVNLIL
ncbi:MAG: hypothetical protein LBS62_14375 [Clostridiales bacterium]|jgi:hypothetical protein|nr:hypothetical protein [Clostridiales bacterium]